MLVEDASFLGVGRRLTVYISNHNTPVLRVAVLFHVSVFFFSPRCPNSQMSGQAGSKRFMAPEVCQGLPYNEKVDVYSFSIVLWELCSLRKPFAGMSVEDHYRQVAEQGHRPPLDPRWPPALRNLLEKSWHTNPDARPSMVEVRDTLRHIIADW